MDYRLENADRRPSTFAYFLESRLLTIEFGGRLVFLLVSDSTGIHEKQMSVISLVLSCCVANHMSHYFGS